MFFSFGCLRVVLAGESAEAREVGLGRPEGVDGRARVGARAGGNVGCVLLLRLGPALGASAADSGVEAITLADTMLVHAVLHEEILAPRQTSTASCIPPCPPSSKKLCTPRHVRGKSSWRSC